RIDVRDSLNGLFDYLLRDEHHSFGIGHLSDLSAVMFTLCSLIVFPSEQPAIKSDEDFDPLFIGINSSNGRIVENALKVATLEKKLRGEMAPHSWWIFVSLSAILDR